MVLQKLYRWLFGNVNVPMKSNNDFVPVLESKERIMDPSVLFDNYIRMIQGESFKEFVKENPQMALRLTAQIRDRMGGKGERDLGVEGLVEIAKLDWERLRKNIPHWDDYGRMDDWLKVFGKVEENTIRMDLLSMMKKQIFRDFFWMKFRTFLQNNKSEFYENHSDYENYICRFESVFDVFYLSDDFQLDPYFQMEYDMCGQDKNRFLTQLDTCYAEWYIRVCNGEILIPTVENPNEYMIVEYGMNGCVEDVAFTKKIGVSLFAKWFPSEGKHLDKKYHLYSCLTTYMNIRPCDFRKYVLVPLRSYLDIVEKKMCENDWTNIGYEKVPEYCMKKNRKVFERKDRERFEKYMNEMRKGKRVVQTVVSEDLEMEPYEIVAQYVEKIVSGNENELCLDEVLEEQWKRVEKEWKMREDIVWMVDLSGSMTAACTEPYDHLNPMIVAMSLSLLGSTVMTFSEESEVLTIPSSNEYTLAERIRYMIYKMSECKVGNSIISIENVLANVKTGTKRLIILTDMDWMVGDLKSETLEIVYWNVGGMKTQTMILDKNVLYVSGFSPMIYEKIGRGEWMAREYFETILESNRYQQLIW